MQKITLTIPAKADHIILLSNSINSLLTLSQLTTKEQQQIHLSLIEAINNIIRYAFPIPSVDAQIRLDILFDETQLSFRFNDNGNAPKNTLWQQPKQNNLNAIEDIDALPESGWGLSIIHQTMDEISYVRKNNQNYLHLTKNYAI